MIVDRVSRGNLFSCGAVLSNLQVAVSKPLWRGYRTSGILMSTSAFLENNSNSTVEKIRDTLIGRIWRNAGYAQIVDAAVETAETIHPNNSEAV